MAANSNPRGASAKSSSPPSYCFARPELVRRIRQQSQRSIHGQVVKQIIKARSIGDMNGRRRRKTPSRMTAAPPIHTSTWFLLLRSTDVSLMFLTECAVSLAAPVRSKLGKCYGDTKVYRCLRRDRSVLTIGHPLSCNKQTHWG